MISIIFIWGEIPLCLSCRLNDSKIASYATSLAAIGTIAAMVLLRNQLVEMEIARKLSYRPILIPEGQKSKTEDITGEIEIGMEFEDGFVFPTLSPLFTSNSGMKSYYLEIKVSNVGKGIAKNVSITWEFDESELIAFIGNEYDTIDARFHSDYPINQNLSFLREGEHHFFRLPALFSLCCGKRLNSQRQKMHKPKIALVISYEDLHDPAKIIARNELSVLTAKSTIITSFHPN